MKPRTTIEAEPEDKDQLIANIALALDFDKIMMEIISKLLVNECQK
jgi:hypothetical protein